MKIKCILNIIFFLIITLFLFSCRDNCQFWKKEHKTDIQEGLKKYVRPFQQIGKTWIYVNSDSTDYDTLKVIDYYMRYVEYNNPCERFESINIKITSTIGTNLYQPEWPMELKANVETTSWFYSDVFSIIFHEENSEYKTAFTYGYIVFYNEFFIGNNTYNNVIESSRPTTVGSNDSIAFFLSPESGIIKYKIGNLSFSLLKII